MKVYNIGETVLVKKYNITGSVVEKLSARKYLIERIDLTFIVDVEELEIVNKNTKYENIKVTQLYDFLDNVYEIDLHGYSKSEAINEVKYIVENAQIHQFPIIKITHGKGKGVLRMSIHDLLKEYKELEMIKAYEFAQDNKGGYGVTIVYIK